MITLIYGGSGSGKSEYAEQLVLDCSEPEQRYYIATMMAYGEEGRARVQRHRTLRQGKGFTTIECPVEIEQARTRILSPKPVLLLECVSNLVANEMFDSVQGEEDIVFRIVNDISKLSTDAEHVILVTNNIFEDGMGYEETTRRYASYLGEVNRALSQMADRVVEVVVGMPILIKGEGQFASEGEHLVDEGYFTPEKYLSEQSRIRHLQVGNEMQPQTQKEHKMMRLIIGGAFQGKLEYAISQCGKNGYVLIDERNYQDAEDLLKDGEDQTIIVNHLHTIMRRLMEPAAAWLSLVQEISRQGDCELVFLCDELGCGVVPNDPEDRRWRELVGRTLCGLAQKADQVERMVCGLPQKIK